MANARCYTPQLQRELVSRLYHRARAERVPMTVLANRLMEQALTDSRPLTTAPAAEAQERRSE